MATIRGHGPTKGTFRGAHDGAAIWWVAPTYPVAKQVIWPQLRKALKMVAARISEAEHSIVLPNGGSVTVKSADNPDNLRGMGLDGLVMDEAAFSDRRVWYEVLRPMLADRNGWAMFLTSPNGCNWFYELFNKATGPEWQRWQKPTRENAIITSAELQSSRETMGPRTFAQEFEAKFTEEAGSKFPVEYFNDSIWFGPDEWPSPRETVFKCIACDPSLGKTDLSDYSALILLAKDIHGRYFVAGDLERRPPAQIITDSLKLYRDFEAQAIGFETVAFQELLLAEFNREALASGVDAMPYGIGPKRRRDGRAMSKPERILDLDKYLAQDRLRFLRGDRGTELLVEQLRGFPLKKYHDDGPDALEMAIRLCESILSGSALEAPQYEEEAVT